MENHKILICDDNPDLHQGLSAFFRQENFQVTSVYDAESIFPILAEDSIDLIILDVMLPGMSGIEACRKIRETSQVPIIFLTAKAEEVDTLLGLEIGGDDYVTKPFSSREVVLRAKKLIARSGSLSVAENPDILNFRELEVNPHTLTVKVSGQVVDMTAREVYLLIYFIENAGKVLNREQILSAVWGYDYMGDTRSVDAAVKRIRRKLPTEGIGFAIESIYGVGYRLGEIYEE